MPNALSPVTFHGDTIFCTTYQNQPYTAMKPIIENMGLDWRSQQRKLSGCAERWGVVIMTIPSSSGNQETLCMPVRKLPAFLNTINPKKVRPELRERIELYQAESDDVLWEYWTNQQAMRDTPAGYLSIEDRRPLSVLVGQWAGKARMSFPDCWRELHTVFGISSVSDLPAAQLPAALAWVQAKIDAIAPKPKKALPVPSHYLDLTRTDPIAPNELVDVLSSITYRMDITCHTELDEEFEKGRKLFSKATKNDKRLEYMICSSLVGSKFTTRDMLKSALRMAENAAKTHFLVCEAGK